MAVGLVVAVVVGVVAGNAVADVTDKWREHNPHTKDIQSMEDNYGANGDSFYLWRGRPGNGKNQPKGRCLSSIARLIGCALLGGALVEIGRKAVQCTADYEKCVGDPQPGQLVVTSPTSTATATPSPVLYSACPPPYIQCSAQNTPQQTPTPVVTQQPTVTTPMPKNTIKKALAY